jgi:hypothetical protein
LLGKADRMMQRCLHNRKANLAALGRSSQRTGKADRVDIGANPVEMMLGEPNNIDPELFGQPRFAQRLVDHDAIPRGIPAVRKQKVAELHPGPPPTLAEVSNALVPGYFLGC